MSEPAMGGRAGPPGRAVMGAAILAFVLGCGAASFESIERGDRLFAVGDVEGAIAEYKLATRQHGEDPELLLRLGHAYAVSGDVDESLRYYAALLEQDSSYTYQAATDLATVARAALDQGARDNMSRALQPVLSWGLGLIPADLQLELGRYYWSDGDYPRALPLFLTVLAEEPDVDPLVYYEAGRAYEELSGCRRSLELFELYLARSEGSGEETASAQWHLGNCLFLVADEDREAGRPRSALDKLDRMIDLGVPQTRIDVAHFNRGELLVALGDRSGALAAFEEVLRMNRTRTKPIVQRAEQRIRQLRFDSD